MRVVTEHRPPDPERFTEEVRQLFEVLRHQPGFLHAELGRSPDEPDVWLLASRWLDPGTMRRAMGSFEAKVLLGSIMASARDQVSVYEVVLSATAEAIAETDSDLSPVVAPEL